MRPSWWSVSYLMKIDQGTFMVVVHDQHDSLKKELIDFRVRVRFFFFKRRMKNPLWRRLKTQKNCKIVFNYVIYRKIPLFYLKTSLKERKNKFSANESIGCVSQRNLKGPQCYLTPM